MGYKNKHKGQSTQHGGDNQSTTNSNVSKPKSKFEGKEEEIKEHIFDVGSTRAADLYTKSMEAIVNYVKKTYKQGHQIAHMLEDLEEIDFGDPPAPDILEDNPPVEPNKPRSNASQATMDEYQTQMEEYLEEKKEFDIKKRHNDTNNDYKLKRYHDKIEQYEDNKVNVFGLIIGQCTPTMCRRLEQSENWKPVKRNNNAVELVKMIKSIALQGKENVYEWVPIYESLVRLLTIKQGPTEGMNSYSKRFQAEMEVLNSLFGGSMLSLSLLESKAAYTAAADEDAKVLVRDKIQLELMAYAFIRGSSEKKSEELLKSLGNAFSWGDDKYPKSLDKAVTAITNYSVINYKQEQPSNPSQLGTAHAQSGDSKPPAKHLCYRCGKPGCRPSQCPFPKGYKHWSQKKKAEYEKFQSGSVFAQSGHESSEESGADTDDESVQSTQKETGNYHFGTGKPQKSKKSSKPTKKRKKIGID